jgi:hypothetical protein
LRPSFGSATNYPVGSLPYAAASFNSPIRGATALAITNDGANSVSKRVSFSCTQKLTLRADIFKVTDQASFGIPAFLKRAASVKQPTS